MSADESRRKGAQRFHEQLMGKGKVPLLSWHHLEELLCIQSSENVRARVAYLQGIPFIAWMRFPGEPGVGSVTDILAAEAIAFDAGCSAPVEVRDNVKSQLLRMGPAIEAIGHENWVWEVIRPLMIRGRSKSGMIAALSVMKTFDEQQTIGQLTNRRQRSPAERHKVLTTIRAGAMRNAMEADPKREPQESRAMADDFILRALELMPDENVSVRDAIVATYARFGVEADEVRDECTVAELSALATFRSQLRVIAEQSNLSFERLKRVRMQSLPSWRIGDALRRFGQQRKQRPGSDVHDLQLAVLAAYTDELYVDKRTHEDFRRVIQKEPELALLFGKIVKASNYQEIIG